MLQLFHVKLTFVRFKFNIYYFELFCVVVIRVGGVVVILGL